MRIYWSIKKRLHRLFGKRFSVKERQGKFLLLDNLNWIDTRLVIGQPYEEEQISFAKSLIQNNQCDVFLDIGANIGLYSVYIGALDSLKESHAFEPVLRNFYQLNANLMLNDLHHKVLSHRAALSSSEGSVTINIDPNSTGVSRIDFGDRDAAQFTQEELVDTKTLDSLYSWVNRKIFMKIDVEGHEIEALKGMKKTLMNNDVVILVEAFSGSASNEVEAHLNASGFQKYPNSGGDHLFANFELVLT